MLFNDEDTYAVQLDEIGRLFRIGGFTHKMPKNGVASKVVVRSMEMVQDVKDGMFLDKWEIDATWLSENVTDRDRVLRIVAKDPIGYLERCLELRRHAVEDKTLFPRDKRTLDCDFPSFLCNPRSGKSWFIHFLMHGNQTLAEAEAEEWVGRVPKSFHTTLTNMGLSRWEKDLPYYAEGVVRLHMWYKENRKDSAEWMWIRSPSDFWSSYVDYVCNITGGKIPSKGYFMPEGNTHRSWRRSIGI